MKVTFKNLHIEAMAITDAGIELEVRDPDARDHHVGDLIITRDELLWGRGRASVALHVITWQEFVEYMEHLPVTRIPKGRRIAGTP